MLDRKQQYFMILTLSLGDDKASFRSKWQYPQDHRSNLTIVVLKQLLSLIRFLQLLFV